MQTGMQTAMQTEMHRRGEDSGCGRDWQASADTADACSPERLPGTNYNTASNGGAESRACHGTAALAGRVGPRLRPRGRASACAFGRGCGPCMRGLVGASAIGCGVGRFLEGAVANGVRAGWATAGARTVGVGAGGCFAKFRRGIGSVSIPQFASSAALDPFPMQQSGIFQGLRAYHLWALYCTCLGGGWYRMGLVAALFFDLALQPQRPHFYLLCSQILDTSQIFIQHDTFPPI